MSIPIKTLDGNFAIPAMGQGTWRMGGADTTDPANPDELHIAAIRRGIEAGLYHIDTAEMYAAGHSEELVGAAIRPFPRKELFLTDKVWKNHLKADDLRRALEASLARLGTDYLDLYLIHQVNPDVPLEETIRAMNRLQEEKLVGSIGVSNFTEERLKRAQACSDYPIVVNQLHYNLKVRAVEQGGLAEYCRRTNVMLVAWRPLRDVDLNTPILLELARQYQRTPAQIALNWLLCQPGVVTIVKAVSPEHLSENLGSVGWKLSTEDLERLRVEFPGQTGESTVPLI